MNSAALECLVTGKLQRFALVAKNAGLGGDGVPAIRPARLHGIADRASLATDVVRSIKPILMLEPLVQRVRVCTNRHLSGCSATQMRCMSSMAIGQTALQLMHLF